MVSKLTPVLIRFVLALALLSRSACAVSVFDLTFEEPVHHAGSAPTLGDAPDRVSSIVFGAPTVLADPSTVGNQVLELRAGSVYSQILLSIPRGLTSTYTVEFDVFTKEMSGSNYGFTVFLDTPQVRSVTLHGPLRQIDIFNPFVYTGTQLAPFADDTPYHFLIAVDTAANQWVVTVNGAEIGRQAFNATDLYSIRFSVAPMYGNMPASAAPRAYLDNIKLTDTRQIDRPTFIKGPDLTINEDAGQVSTPWATAIDAGPSDVPNPASHFNVTTDAPELFSSAPAISPAGILYFTPAPDANGVAKVTVTLQNDGGTSTGHDESDPVDFTITINPIDDAPTFTLGPDLTVLASGLPQTRPSWVSAIRAGPANESGQGLHFVVSVDDPLLFTAAPTIAPDGTLSFTPGMQFSGTATATVTLVDDGETGGGNRNTSAPQNFAIHVVPLPDLSGNYTGLIQPSPVGPITSSRVGLLSLTATKGRKFTGRVTLGGTTQPLQGRVDVTGQAVFGPKATPTCLLKRRGQSDLKLQFVIDQDSGAFKLNGYLTQEGAAFADIQGNRALFAFAEMPAPFRHVPPEMLGFYDVVFGTRTFPAVFPSLDQTRGKGLLTVSPSGMATLVATLSDGTKISYSNFVSVDGQWPLYVPLSRGGASISGLVAFRHLSGGSDVDAQEISRFTSGWPFLNRLNLLGINARNGPLP